MKKLNDYQMYYLIKRSFGHDKVASVTYNGKKVIEINFKSVELFAGVARIEIKTLGSNDTIYADIQDIKVNILS
jgi:hypothetical protein